MRCLPPSKLDAPGSKKPSQIRAQFAACRQFVLTSCEIIFSSLFPHSIFRRSLLILCKRTLIFLLLTCVSLAAQAPSPELTQRIERQIRSYYDLPDSVKITLSAPHASDFPNYDSYTVSMEGDGNKKTFDFLLSKDQ